MLCHQRPTCIRFEGFCLSFTRKRNVVATARTLAMDSRFRWAGAVCAMLLIAMYADGVRAALVTGEVQNLGGDPLANARVTLFTPDLDFFRETRSGATGAYVFVSVPSGSYRLGCARRGFAYLEEPIVVAGDRTVDFTLPLETESGSWDSIGTTEPEFLDATDIGLLLPDGRLFFCHDTTDPILFDPVTRERVFAAASPSEQGCMNGSLLPDGTVIFMGGQDGDDPGSFRDAIPWVKRYDPAADAWDLLPDMLAPNGRWYPGLARLADGSFLVMGGGTAPDAARTDTCERFDLATGTWSFTGSMLTPTEFPPVALLETGQVLATWYPPQLYDPVSGLWRATGSFVQSSRFYPGHSDHSVVVLADGRVLAIGIGGLGPAGIMGEVYDPATETWSLTSTSGLQRFQCEVVALPDGRILVAGGQTEASPPPVESVLGVVRWSDLYDPDLDTWRRVADVPTFREYHGVSLLLPDGRVAATGGTRIQFQYGPTSGAIEAFTPPYLKRGVRPEITWIAATDLLRGGSVGMTVFPETEISSLVLMGMESTTHWVSAGIPRRIVLTPTQDGTTVLADLPDEEARLPVGYYLLFAMVDDIPSEAVVVRVLDESATEVGGSGSRAGAALYVVPNPTTGPTWVRWRSQSATGTEAVIVDVGGRFVRTLSSPSSIAWRGETGFAWDGHDAHGRTVPAGTYWVVLRTREGAASARFVVVR